MRCPDSELHGMDDPARTFSAMQDSLEQQLHGVERHIANGHSHHGQRGIDERRPFGIADPNDGEVVGHS